MHIDKAANSINYSVIIFCYNEAKNLSHVINSALLFLEKNTTNHELIIVDDGSTDNTHQIIMELSQRNSKVKIIRHTENKGIGMALKTGYNAAEMEYICAIPGDGQFDINELEKVKPFNNNLYYSFYRKKTDYNLYRKSLTWLNRLFNQHLLGIYIRDVNWIKVYRNEQLKKINPKLCSSLIESEICSKLYKCGITPIEIPTDYLPRIEGEAKGGNLKNLVKLTPEVVRLFFDIHFKFNPNIF